jgi:hypothetical protein
LPDPSSPASIGWVIIILTGLIVSVRSGIGLFKDLRDQPPSGQLDQRLGAMESEVEKLTLWKDKLISKLEADKLEMISKMETNKVDMMKEAELRASKTHKRLNAILVAVVALQTAAKLPPTLQHNPSDDEQSSL